MKKCRFLFHGIVVMLALPGMLWAEPGPVENTNIEQTLTPSISTEAADPAAAPARTIPSAETDVTTTDSGNAPAMPAEQPVANKTVADPTDPPTLSPQALAIQQALAGDTKSAANVTLFRKAQIRTLYEANHFAPLWNSIAINSLADALQGLTKDGLNPAEYQFEAIAPYLENPSLAVTTPEGRATQDILFTESFLRALYNLRYGKVDPERLDGDFNYPKARDTQTDLSQLLAWIREGHIDVAFDWARPAQEEYKQLQTALAHYREIAATETWEPIPSGRSLKPGTTDSRIPLLRARLGISEEAESKRYDETLVEAVKAFQAKNKMKEDGIIGPATLAALNLSQKQRVDQIRANLERQRWFDPLTPEEYLEVDVAGFQIRWIDHGQVVWQEKVQVGKPLTKTPIFRDQIEHIIFNPTWSVPPSIKARTILPSLKLDASYLSKKGYQLLDSQGHNVDPYTVDWTAMSSMPYTVRQPPGRGNALGLVKFMFPNKHSVFLHDTNHRSYFSRETRTTSSGCIRLNDPFELAERLLGRQGWDRARVDKTSQAGRTQQVNLKKPLPIIIRYLTAVPSEERVSFRRDIYKRDAKLLAALDAPFSLHLPELPKARQAGIRSRIPSASKAKHLAANPEIIGTPVVVATEPVPEPEPEQKPRTNRWKSGFDL